MMTWFGSKLKTGLLIFAHHKFTVNFENPQDFADVIAFVLSRKYML